MVKLGDFHFSGLGLAVPDVREAMVIYDKASQLGSTEALVNLGAILEEGHPPAVP